MVARAFTFVGFLIAGLVGSLTAPAYATPQTGRAEAVARVTIMRPVSLKTGGDARVQFASAGLDVAIRPRPLIRQCATGARGQCKLIVFDMP